MQNAETVLGVLRERGRKGLPCNELYRQMFNKELYLLAYGRIYANQGAMTPGASAETADGMSEEKIDAIIEAMRHERYRFAPARRVLIPKKNGKMRPLGTADHGRINSSAKWCASCWRRTTSRRSPAIRTVSGPGRGCHTALREMAAHLDRDHMVHRGRHLRLLRVSLTTRSCSGSWRRRSTITGSCG